MENYPILSTIRLILRQFRPEEAMVVRSLAGSYEIAHGCLTVPHPYGIEIAQAWIASHEEWFREKTQVVFAITRKEDGWIIGAAGLMNELDHNRAEIGYWIGLPFWGHGYATEAAEAVLKYAFEGLKVHRVTASYFRRNPASGRVIEKIGMQREGVLRNHILKEGIYEDVIVCGILDTEWRESKVFQNDLAREMNQ